MSSERSCSPRELRRAARKLAHAQRLACLGSWDWDLARDRMSWSDELYTIVGVAPGAVEPSYDAYRRMTHPADRRELERAVSRTMASKTACEVRHRIVRPDGEVRSVCTVVDADIDERGEIACLFGLVQDVTRDLESEQRKGELARARFAKQEALLAEKRVREVLEAIPQQVWVTDADGKLLMVNERVRAYFGLTARGASVVGGVAVAPPIDSLGSLTLRTIVHPDDYERAVRAWQQAKRSRSAFSVELRLIRDGGREARWHLCRAEPQLARDGTIERWIGTNTDLRAVREAKAERARAEREARQERRRLRTIFERAPAAICITRGPEHHLMAANAAFRALASGHEAVGQPLATAFRELASQGITDLLTRVYESGRPYVGREIPIRARRGSGGAADAYFNLVLQPLADAHGATEGVLLHAVDVTDMLYARLAVEEKAAELEQLTRHLEAANEELDRFAYVTSHDLRAPLRGISNLAQWIEEDLRDSAAEETKEHLALLRGRVNRLERLIDGVLQYARAGKESEQLERVDVGRLVEDLLDLLAPPSDTRIEIEGALPVLVTERVPLAQVFQNLIHNATTHGRGDGGAHVRIGATRAGEAWSFFVSDRGPGIDPRFHERIWEMFQTLTTNGRNDGTGIGLPLVRKIVESRGGMVAVESLPGAGATFRFTWPEQPSRMRGHARTAEGRIPGSRSARPTPPATIAPARRRPKS